jgi:hypothetical protein
MKTPAMWLAEQIGERPDDFAPEEMAMPLSWIASIQADARKNLLVALESIANNSCCGPCQEAKLVARNALKDAQ